MYKYDRLTKLNELLPDVRTELVKELNENESWRIFANSYANTYDFYELVSTIENENTKNPGEMLLNILAEHECDVEVFCLFLKECQLHNTLLILQNPEPLRITVQPTASIASNGNSIEMELGSLNLGCKAEGLPPPQYQWLHKANIINNGKSSDLNIEIQSDSQEGKYVCKVYQLNEKHEIVYEAYTDPVFVKVKITPICINKQPPEFLEIKQDQTLYLDCVAISHPTPLYQWYKDGKEINNQCANKLIVHNFSPSKEGRYHCLITNGSDKVHTQSSLVMTYTDREKSTVKVALLIANQEYQNQKPLKTPRYEVSTVAKVLKELGFYVICLTDLTLSQMKNAVSKFCEFLTEGAYGFYYYSGHGIQTHYKYMWPIDVPACDYKHKDMLCENWLLRECLLKNPALLVVVLDMCLSLPDSNDNPETCQELPQFHEYKSNRNLIVAYSTSSYYSSYERVAPGNYVSYSSILCKYLSQNLTANKVFELVGKAFQEKMKGKQKSDQIPMYSSSVVKPYRLTGKISCDEKQKEIQNNLKSLIRLPQSWNFSLTHANITFKSEQLDYNYVNTISNDSCEIQCPRTISGTILIDLFRSNERNSLGAFALNLGTFIPLLEEFYKCTP